jgi:uncharacterized phage protein (predicted DNA packaging)
LSNVVTLAEVKLHLRITQNNEDSLLQLYIEAAEDYIRNFLNTGILGFSDSPQTATPSAIKAAALLTIADLYENREGAAEKEIKENPAVMRLLYPYRENIGI